VSPDCAAIAGEALTAAASSGDYDGDWLFAAVALGEAFGFAVTGYPGPIELTATLAGHITACLAPDAWAPGDLTHTAGPAAAPLVPPDRVTRPAPAAGPGPGSTSTATAPTMTARPPHWPRTSPSTSTRC
jgi:hypothetical protein